MKNKKDGQNVMVAVMKTKLMEKKSRMKRRNGRKKRLRKKEGICDD